MLYISTIRSKISFCNNSIFILPNIIKLIITIYIIIIIVIIITTIIIVFITYVMHFIVLYLINSSSLPGVINSSNSGSSPTIPITSSTENILAAIVLVLKVLVSFRLARKGVARRAATTE